MKVRYSNQVRKLGWCAASVVVVLSGASPEHFGSTIKVKIMITRTKPITIDSIDVDNDEELDALLAKVHAAGDKICHAEVQEAIKLGIIDAEGNLLKHELPDDMR